MQHRISAGAIVEQDRRILLARHQRPGHYDFWVAPGGGVQGSEALSEAAVREVREESGLIVEARDMLYIEELLQPDIRHCKFWFAARVIGGELSTAAPEATAEYIVEAAWLSRAEMAGKIVFPPVLSDQYWESRALGRGLGPMHIGLREILRRSPT